MPGAGGISFARTADGVQLAIDGGGATTSLTVDKKNGVTLNTNGSGGSNGKDSLGTPPQASAQVGNTRDTQPTVTPEQTSGSSTKRPSSLTFPSTLNNVKYFITFQFKSETRMEAFSPKIAKEEVSIHLPMPSSLVERFNIGYSAQSLGTIFGGAMDLGVPQALLAIGENANQGNIQDAINSSTAKIKEASSAPGNVQALVRSVVKTLTDTGARVLDKATGTALNPYQSLFFDAPELRSHTFSFRLSPNNPQESRVLKQIINEFKIRMHPEKNGLVFTYPDRCKITMSAGKGNNRVYEIYDSYLKSLSVNYAPQGTPSFYRDGAPSEVELTLEFGEIEIITREVVAGLKPAPNSTAPGENLGSPSSPKTDVKSSLVNSKPSVFDQPPTGRQASSLENGQPTSIVQ